MGNPSRDSQADRIVAGPLDMKDLYLNQLDERTSNNAGADRRQHERISQRVSDGLEVIFTGPDGRQDVGRVRPRNISQSGIAFLYEAFLFPDTRCTIVLRGVNEQPVEISGEVVDCRHVEGKLHEIAVRFDRPLASSDFEGCLGKQQPVVTRQQSA